VPHRVLGFRQRSLHPLSRRLRDAVWNGLARRPPRSQRVYLVTINGRRYKRVVLPDAHHAAQVAARLREFGPAQIYPSLIFEREREVWVEFVEGERPAAGSPDAVDGVADLLAVLLRRAPVQTPLSETPFLHDLRVDLRFLAEVGVLGRRAADALDERAQALAPDAVWVGYDCTDAILKNFVRTPDGRIRAVDVESLGAGQLLGSGAAKACLRWVGPFRGRFLDRLRAAGVPDFSGYLPFVELCFLAFWTKSSFLEGKSRFVDPALFERFRADGR
jgi:hypothetical protein